MQVTIETLGSAGDGVAKLDGEPVFVPGTVPGDVVDVQITRRRGKPARGAVTTLIEPGPDRVTPPCPHFGECGGCQLQHVGQSAYLAWKQAKVSAALDRRGLDVTCVQDIVATPAGTRRRADFVAINTARGVLLGFYRRGSHQVVDIGACHVVTEPVNAILPAVRQLLQPHLPVGGKASAVILSCDNGLDVLLEWRVAEAAGVWQDLAAFADLHDLAAVSVRDVKTGDITPAAIRRPPVMRMGSADMSPPPGAFLQASAEAETILRKLVLEGVGEATAVADLFAGCGTFALSLSDGRRVHAVEGDETLAAALKTAVDKTGGRINTSVDVRDLFRRPLSAKELAKFDAVVFDPPRAGAKEQSETLAASTVGRAVAVSCEPATFARDVRILVDGGFVLEKVVPVDQFVWSTHVEVVGVLSRPD